LTIIGVVLLPGCCKRQRSQTAARLRDQQHPEEIERTGLIRGGTNFGRTEFGRISFLHKPNFARMEFIRKLLKPYFDGTNGLDRRYRTISPTSLPKSIYYNLFYQIPFYQSQVLPKSSLFKNGTLPNSVLPKFSSTKVRFS
jgi:hypothetical protein